MMLPLLNHREAGLSSPLYVRRNLKSRRVSSIDLNEFKSMEQTFNSGILSIDMESQDRRYLIAASSESKVAIYDTAIIENEKECCCSAIAVIDRSQECAHQYSIETVQWYPGDNGMFLTSSLDKSLKVWDSNTLQVAEEYKFSNLVYRHHMSNKHNLVAVGCEGSKIILCDLKSGSTSHTLEGHKNDILALCWSPRSDYVLASGSKDNQVCLWDVRKPIGCLVSLDQHNGDGGRTFSHKTAHNGHVNGLAYTNDGLHLLSYGRDKSLRLWDVCSAMNSSINYGPLSNDRSKGVQLSVSSDLCRDIVYVPSGISLVAFEISSGKELQRYVGHHDVVNCCYYDTNYQEIYSGGCDNQLLLWSPHLADTTDNNYEDQPNWNEVTYDKFAHDAWSSDDD